MKAQREVEAAHLAGKYLTFSVKDEYYGVNVNMILQIIAIPEITPVPKAPFYVKGVINLRGKIVPVIDLRQKFDIPWQEYDERTSIIIFRFKEDGEEVCIGIIVDKVLEVLDIHIEDIEKTPSFGVKFDSQFLLGMAKVKSRVVSLLNIHSILTEVELHTNQMEETA